MDHDQRWKQIFVRFLRDFIALFFPQWLDRFDWRAIEWLDKEAFLDPPQGKRGFLDVVARIGLREPVSISSAVAEATLLLVHVEIESGDSVSMLRPRMPRYYETLRSRHGLPVLPIALYLRVGLEGIGWDVYEETIWDHSLLRFSYPYIGLPALDAKTYLAGENLLGVALSALMRISDEDRALLKADAMQRLASSKLPAADRYLLCECVEAYLPLDAPSLTEYDRILSTTNYKEAFMVAQTSYEKGMEKGMDRGMVLGRLNSVLAILEEKFDAVPTSLKTRIEQMSGTQLDRFVREAIRAKSLVDLEDPNGE